MPQAPPIDTAAVNASRFDRIGVWNLAQAVLLLAIAGYFCLTWRTVHHDCSLGMQYAQLILEGQTPFVDFFDTNPPAVMYLNVPPAALAAWLGIDARIAFYAYVYAMLVGSTWLIGYLLRRLRPALEPAEIGVLGLAWLAATLNVVRAGEFGQREHMFILAAGPMFFFACCDAKA